MSRLQPTILAVPSVRHQADRREIDVALHWNQGFSLFFVSRALVDIICRSQLQVRKTK